MMYIEWIITIVFIIYILVSVSNVPILLISSLLIINIALEALSINFIEYGAYNIELGMLTYRNDVTLGLLLNLFIFFFSLKFVCHNDFKSSNLQFANCPASMDNKVNFFLSGIVFCCILMQLVSLAIYGVPLMNGGSKVFAAENNFVTSILGGSASYLSFACGILFYLSKKKFYFVLFCFQIIILILQANKFTSIVHNFVAFFAIYIVSIEKIKINFKIVSIAIISLCLILIVFYNVYSAGNQFSNEIGLSVWQAMGYRAFYLVAHTYWGMYYYFQSGLIEVNLDKFLDAAKYMVRLMNPDPNIEESLERGTTYGMAFPGYLFFIVPPIFFPIFSLVLGAFSGIAVKLVSNTLTEGKYLKSIIMFVLLNHIHHILIQGNFYKIYSIKTFIIILFLILYAVFISDKRNISC